MEQGPVLGMFLLEFVYGHPSMEVTSESVKQALSSADFGDRLRAVNALRQLTPAVAFELLQVGIADSNARVRYAAVSQLSTLGQQNLDLSLEILRDRLVNDPESDVQAAAADALGGLKLTAAFEDLETLFRQTSEWLLQFSIIATLGELGDQRAYDLLVETIREGQDLLQLAAIGSLGELGDRRAIPVLASFRSHPDWQIRHRVAQSLTQLGGDEIRALLEPMTQDSVAPVAEAARLGL
jgi:HEAT repeat protein